MRTPGGCRWILLLVISLSDAFIAFVKNSFPYQALIDRLKWERRSGDGSLKRLPAKRNRNMTIPKKAGPFRDRLVQIENIFEGKGFEERSQAASWL